jgi:hypothetical protein
MATFIDWDKKNTSNKKRPASFRPDWILKSTSGVPTIMAEDIDGVDYINVSKHGTTEIGQKLAPGYPLEVKVRTPFGVIGTIRNFQDYVTKTGYPQKLLGKSKLYKNEADLIYKLKPVDVPNYWALVAMVLCERVKMSKQLKSLIRKLGKNVVFTSFNEIKHIDLWNASIATSVSNTRMGIYLSIIRHIKIMLDENRFNDENIRTFVEACKNNPDVDLYEGVACAMKIIEEEPDLESGSTLDGLPDTGIDQELTENEFLELNPELDVEIDECDSTDEFVDMTSPSQEDDVFTVAEEPKVKE